VRSSGDAEVRLVHGELGPLESLRDALRAAGRRAEIQPSEIDVPGAGQRAEAGE
jgi:hypothetical protein